KKPSGSFPMPGEPATKKPSGTFPMPSESVRKPSGVFTMPSEPPARQSGAALSATRRSPTEIEVLNSKIAELEGVVAQEKSLREAGSQDDAVRHLQSKVAELNAQLSADKRAKDQLARERM